MSDLNIQKVVKEKESQIRNKWGSVDNAPYIEKYFWGFPPLRPYSIKSAFGPEYSKKYGNNKCWSADIVSDLYLKGKPVEKVLSICCGFGQVEQHMVPYLESVRECLAIDIAPDAIEKARAMAQLANLDQTITYKVADLNVLDWHQNDYDLVIANGALHHLANLEKVITGIRYSLKPKGVLYANEYVGPNYQEHGHRQLELINAMAYLVPPELRRMRTKRHSTKELLAFIWDILTGRHEPPEERAYWPYKYKLAHSIMRVMAGKLPYKSKKVKLPLLHKSQKNFYLKSDPSECVRSSEIIDIVKSNFNYVKVHQYGGSLLAYALDERFYNKFNNHNVRHRKLLELLIAIEESFIDLGEIPIEYAIIVASNDAF